MKENWEINWEDYYKILGVNHTSDDTAIKKAYLYKAWLLSADHMIGAPEHTKLRAQEELKKVNYANDVLKDPEKRKSYDREYLQRMGKSEYNSVHSQPIIKPKPVVNPAIIRFMDVAPGETNTGSFTVENSGGHYSTVEISNSNSWLIVSRKPLSDTKKLPLVVEIKAKGDEWGKTYIENIIIKVDDIETHVRVELRTKRLEESSQDININPVPASLQQQVIQSTKTDFSYKAFYKTLWAFTFLGFFPFVFLFGILLDISLTIWWVLLTLYLGGTLWWSYKEGISEGFKIKRSTNPTPPNSSTNTSQSVVVNIFSSTYHKPTCEWVRKISLKNRRFMTKDEAMHRGLKRCNVCQP